MSRWAHTSFLLLVLVTGLASAVPPAGKIAVPVHLSIEAPDHAEPGLLTAFTITAVALADVPLVSIAVDLPDTLTVFSDDVVWQGPMGQGERRVLTFILRMPEHGTAEIRAHAQAWWGEFMFGTEAVLPLSAGTKPAAFMLPPAHDGIRDFSLD